jgi:DNA-binding NarL/FixJ family response regulator
MKILIIDNHSIVLSGFLLIFKNEIPDLTFEQITNVKEEFNISALYNYDMLIMESNIINIDSNKLILDIKNERPTLPILIFSDISDTLFGKRYLQLGAKGYLNKASNEFEIVKAVKSILAGGIYMSEKLIEKMTDDLMFNRNQLNPFEKLSKKEQVISKYLIKGFGTLEIAEELSLAQSSVSTYKFRIKEKLGVKSTYEINQLAAQYNFSNSLFKELN